MPRKNRKPKGGRAGVGGGHQTGYLADHNVKNSKEDGRFVSTKRGFGRSRAIQGSGLRGAARGGGTAAQRGGLIAAAGLLATGAALVSRNPQARRRASTAASAANRFLNVPKSQGGGTAMFRRRKLRRGGL
jgi:hypothetical protein